MQWIAPDSPQPYGPEATFRARRLATPYVVLKASFRRRRVVAARRGLLPQRAAGRLQRPRRRVVLAESVEREPRRHGCTSWLCTQFLDMEHRPSGITAALNAVVHHLWGGPFNLSSEAHEGASTFSKARDEQIDPRVIDVDRWEAESVRDPRFVLDVPWRSTGLTCAN